MTGMDRHSGRCLSGDAHLAQSITDILTTPKGSLVMERDYGSDLPGILDAPLNGETVVDAYMAIAEALDLWEPRVRLGRIALVAAEPGRGTFELYDREGAVLPLDLVAEVAA